MYLQGIEYGAYDQWKLTDTIGEQLDTYEWELDWVMSLIRQEHPYMKDDEYIRAIAEQRLADGYYDEYDF